MQTHLYIVTRTDIYVAKTHTDNTTQIHIHRHTAIYTDTQPYADICTNKHTDILLTLTYTGTQRDNHRCTQSHPHVYVVTKTGIYTGIYKHAHG